MKKTYIVEATLHNTQRIWVNGEISNELKFALDALSIWGGQDASPQSWEFCNQFLTAVKILLNAQNFYNE